MNFLISQVSPDSLYVAFLEGDDRYMLDCIEKKFDIFQKYPEVALVYSDMEFINTHGEITLRSLLQSQWAHFYQDKNIPLNEYILAKNPLIVSYSSIAVRKNILIELFPIQNLTGSKTYAVSDYDLIFRLIEDHKVYGIQESLTQYRRHLSNLSASYGWLFDDLLILIGSYRNDGKITASVYKEKISWIYILKSLSSLASWERWAALDSIKKSFQKDILLGCIYKIIVCLLLILPVLWTQKILQKRMRRGA